MFFAAHDDGSYSPLETAGSSGSTEIKSLQASLGKLAIAAQRVQADPGPANGVIGEKTMISIAALLDKISPNLPMWVVHPLQSALMQGVSSSAAKNTVGQYVTELKWAADKATVLENQLQPPLPSFPSLGDLSDSTAFFAPGWYTIPSRLFVLGGLFLLGCWLWHHLGHPHKEA